MASDVSQMKRMARRIKAASPDTFAEMRKALKESGDLVKAAAAANTTSVKVHRTLRSSVAGGTVVTVSAGNASTLLPKLLEGDGTPGVWRHPVFPHGDRATWHWASQARHPYLAPALRETKDEVVRRLTDAMVRAAEDALR